MNGTRDSLEAVIPRPSITALHLPTSPVLGTDGILPSLPELRRSALGRMPDSGDRLGDFQLLAELGKGAFARVFLARQVSLSRTVALKVSANQSNEARTLASLDHPHIVQVFDETVDRDRNLRLLYMRYVPGTTLGHVLHFLAHVPFAQRNGTCILEAIASTNPRPAGPDDPTLVSALEECDFGEAVCWLGARLAEALAFAHARGVLHRDIKPANILLDQLGRPLLLDFNLAFDLRRDDDTAEAFGGTRAYMAPEHLDAFEGRADTDIVDARSDVYSLGIVLFELLTLTRPPAEERPGEAPSPGRLEPAVPGVLDRVVRRCLEPDPARRYQTAEELAEALEGARQWQHTQLELPRAGPLIRTVIRYPMPMCVVLGSLPHLAGVLFSNTYNALWLTTRPDATAWLGLYGWLVLGCTAVGLLLGYAAVWRQGVPLYRFWGPGACGETADAETLRACRARALAALRATLWPTSLGWLPGTIVVPIVLGVVAGAEVGVYLFLGFAIAGLISLTYRAYAMLFVVLRVGYPTLWGDAAGMWRTARVELAGVGSQVRLLQVLAGLIPLTVGAALLGSRLGVGSGQGGGTGDQLFGVLLFALILLGMIGTVATVWMHDTVVRTLAALIGAGSLFGSGVRHRAIDPVRR